MALDFARQSSTLQDKVATGQILLFDRFGRFRFPAMLKPLATLVSSVILLSASSFGADAGAKKKILFFSKSSGFEHSVISWKNGQPSHAEKVLLELGTKNGWDFTFSKDGSKFRKDYLAQFDAVFFYTTGDLTTPGTDKQPPMSLGGKQALFDYVRSGRGFIGTHSASDTFHTDNESKKGPDRFLNHGEKADAYVHFIGGEFIKHGAQQAAKNTVTNPKFPGFENVGADYTFHEEWYSLKDFTPDLHVLSVIDAPSMKGPEYQRPPYPSTWARKEGAGRVWYTAMGHREDIWTNPKFQAILVGGVKWALGEVRADVPPNLKDAAPGAMTNPPYVPPKPPAPKAAAQTN
jgi:type 1 glutamine amidotransferase